VNIPGRVGRIVRSGTDSTCKAAWAKAVAFSSFIELLSSKPGWDLVAMIRRLIFSAADWDPLWPHSEMNNGKFLDKYFKSTMRVRKPSSGSLLITYLFFGVSV
jgi:hypothetical protein